MNIVILGAGGHGRVVLDILRRAGNCQIAGFIDADTARAGTTLDGLPILGPVNLLPKLRRNNVAGAIVAIGDNRVRLSYAERVLQGGLELVNAIHPAAVISATAVLGRNLVVAAGAVVGPDAHLADSVILNHNAVVDHECRVGRGAHLCPGVLLGGRVDVAEAAFLGLGAKVLPCLRIGPHAVIGAGAVVRHDVPAGATVVGVPGRVISVVSVEEAPG